MSITRTDLESYLLASCQSIVNIALGDPTTGAAPSGATVSAWLNWPIGDAVRQVGYPVAAAANVSNTDLAGFPDSLLPRFLAIATIETKRQLRGSLSLINLQQGTDKQDRAGLAAQLDREIADLQADILRRFGATSLTPRIAAMTSAVDLGAGGLQPWRIIPPRQEWFP